MRQVSRTHRVNLDLLCDRISLDPMIQIKYVGTTQQLADIYTKKGIIHRRQMDTTDTTGEHHDSHHIYSMQLVSSFYGCDSFLQAWAHVPETLSLHRQAWNKSQFIAQDWLREHLSISMPTCGQSRSTSTRISSWRRLQAWKLVSARFWKSEPHDVRCIKLWSTGSGWSIKLQLLQKILQVKRKFIFIQKTDGENYISKFDDLANFKPQSTERARISQSSIEQFMCKIGWISYQSSRFPAQRCDLESIYERLFMAFILAYQGWTNVSQEHKIWHSPCNDK